MAGIGVIAAGHELTARAGERILKRGGNAFDAVLAAYLAACVTEPVLASLGGGGFMLGKPFDSAPILYDFFVQAPRRKQPIHEIDFHPIWADFGKTKQEFHIGQGTVATPGSVRGLFEIHRDLGSLPLDDIAAPAIQYAREGIVLNRLQAYIFSIVSPIYVFTPESRAIFCQDSSRHLVLGEGERMQQVELADAIQRLVIEGPELFYQGEIAREIVKQSQQVGGHLTLEDLARYEVVKRTPLDLTYRDSRVLINPPPSAGGILIAFGLEMLKGLDLAAYDFGSYSHLRRLSEVMQLTAKARADALTATTHVQEGYPMLDSGFLDLYRREVRQRATSLRGTTQISVVDAQGNVASMTVSNGEGCGYIVPNTGIMLNNMLGEQDLNFEGFHLWPEDQRMSSMMSPTLICHPDGRLVATGSGGSNRIRTALLQVIVNLIDFRMDVKTAVASPRIHLEDDKLSVEGSFDANAIHRLTADYRNSEVWTDRNLFFGGAHTVAANRGEFSGSGDPRRDGVCRVVE